MYYKSWMMKTIGVFGLFSPGVSNSLYGPYV